MQTNQLPFVIVFRRNMRASHNKNMKSSVDRHSTHLRHLAFGLNLKSFITAKSFRLPYMAASMFLVAISSVVRSHYFINHAGQTSEAVVFSEHGNDSALNVQRDVNITSKLFPPALDMMRRGIPLKSAYKCFDEKTSFSLDEATKRRHPPRAGLEHVDLEAERKKLGSSISKCSCDDDGVIVDAFTKVKQVKKSNALCCQRRIFVGHKMGTFLIQSDEERLKQEYGIERADFDEFPSGRDVPFTKDHLLEPRIDFRDVMIIRNIYDSIISGYLYHKEGKECWLDWYGQPGWDPNIFPSVFTKRWMRYIDLLSHPMLEPYPTLCHYLANETEVNGMRIYVDWVFHVFYAKTLEFWALSTSEWCEPIEKRVRMYCFEDLASKSTSSSTMEQIIAFLMNYETINNVKSSVRHSESDTGRNQAAYAGKNSQKYEGGHSTSHDPNLRQRLLRTVEQIDREFYNNDIAWLASALPCR